MHCALQSLCAQQSYVSLVGEASSLGPFNFMSTFPILDKIRLPQDWKFLMFSSRRAIMKRRKGRKSILGKSEISVLFSRLTSPGNTPCSCFVSANHWLCNSSGVPTVLCLAVLDAGWPLVDQTIYVLKGAGENIRWLCPSFYVSQEIQCKCKRQQDHLKPRQQGFLAFQQHTSYNQKTEYSNKWLLWLHL